MDDWDVELRSSDRSSHRRVRIAGNDHRIGGLPSQQWLEAQQDAGRLLGVAPRTDSQEVVGLRQIEVVEEGVREGLVVMLARVDERLVGRPASASAAIVGAIFMKFGRAPTTWTILIEATRLGRTSLFKPHPRMSAGSASPHGQSPPGYRLRSPVARRRRAPTTLPSCGRALGRVCSGGARLAVPLEPQDRGADEQRLRRERVQPAAESSSASASSSTSPPRSRPGRPRRREIAEGRKATTSEAMRQAPVADLRRRRPARLSPSACRERPEDDEARNGDRRDPEQPVERGVQHEVDAAPPSATAAIGHAPGAARGGSGRAGRAARSRSAQADQAGLGQRARLPGVRVGDVLVDRTGAEPRHAEAPGPHALDRVVLERVPGDAPVVVPVGDAGAEVRCVGAGAEVSSPRS